MAGRADFTTEQWADLASAMICAVEPVSFVDGGKSGMPREMAEVAGGCAVAPDRICES